MKFIAPGLFVALALNAQCSYALRGKVKNRLEDHASALKEVLEGSPYPLDQLLEEIDSTRKLEVFTYNDWPVNSYLTTNTAKRNPGRQKDTNGLMVEGASGEFPLLLHFDEPQVYDIKKNVDVVKRLGEKEFALPVPELMDVKSQSEGSGKIGDKEYESIALMSPKIGRDFVVSNEEIQIDKMLEDLAQSGALVEPKSPKENLLTPRYHFVEARPLQEPKKRYTYASKRMDYVDEKPVKEYFRSHSQVKAPEVKSLEAVGKMDDDAYRSTYVMSTKPSPNSAMHYGDKKFDGFEVQKIPKYSAPLVAHKDKSIKVDPLVEAKLIQELKKLQVSKEINDIVQELAKKDSALSPSKAKVLEMKRVSERTDVEEYKRDVVNAKTIPGFVVGHAKEDDPSEEKLLVHAYQTVENNNILHHNQFMDQSQQQQRKVENGFEDAKVAFDDKREAHFYADSPDAAVNDKYGLAVNQILNDLFQIGVSKEQINKVIRKHLAEGEDNFRSASVRAAAPAP